MKFRLRSLFALTAVAGVWLFLARFNVWLPVLLAAMFGAPTAAFLLNRPWLSWCAMANVWCVIALWTAPIVLGVRGGSNVARIDLTEVHLAIDSGLALNKEVITDVFDSRFLNIQLINGIHHASIAWQAIVVATLLYGLALLLLAWLLERRGALPRVAVDKSRK